jgi:hypothetical protein
LERPAPLEQYCRGRRLTTQANRKPAIRFFIIGVDVRGMVLGILVALPISVLPIGVYLLPIPNRSTGALASARVTR